MERRKSNSDCSLGTENSSPHDLCVCVCVCMREREREREREGLIVCHLCAMRPSVVKRQESHPILLFFHSLFNTGHVLGYYCLSIAL